MPSSAQTGPRHQYTCMVSTGMTILETHILRSARNMHTFSKQRRTAGWSYILQVYRILGQLVHMSCAKKRKTGQGGGHTQSAAACRILWTGKRVPVMHQHMNESCQTCKGKQRLSPLYVFNKRLAEAQHTPSEALAQVGAVKLCVLLTKPTVIWWDIQT